MVMYCSKVLKKYLVVLVSRRAVREESSQVPGQPLISSMRVASEQSGSSSGSSSR